MCLKSVEKKIMLEVWKEKAPKQAKFMKSHPIQLMRQAKRVYSWSIEANDGKAWVYFVYAACQWLPTNHRNFYEDKSPFNRDKCQLCLAEEVESIEHVWCCPALLEERATLKNNLSRLLADLRLPFMSKRIPSQADKFCQEALKTVRQFMVGKSCRFLNHDRAQRLARDFWKTNELKSTISKTAFRASVVKLLPQCECSEQSHSCGFKDLLTIPKALQRIFQRAFSLSVEANTSSLGRSDIFSEYCTSNLNDKNFGSLGSFWETNLVGKNVLLVYGETDLKFNEQALLDRMSTLIQSKRPTRILFIGPSVIIPKKNSRTILEIAVIPSGLPMYGSADVVGNLTRTSTPFSVLLALNKESMSIDPIDWESFRSELLGWAGESCPNFRINAVTDNLFNERTPLRHPPRALMSPSLEEGGVYRFFDPESKRRNETTHLLSCGIPLELAKTINRINNHDRNLSYWSTSKPTEIFAERGIH